MGVRSGLAICLIALSAPAWAEQPLSVIDWLEAQPTPAAQRPNEPPVAETARIPPVQVLPLSGEPQRMIGLVPPEVTGLPRDLWTQSETRILTRMLANMPDMRLPAAQSLYYTLLLAEALPPAGDEGVDALALARVAALEARGAVDPALALITQIGPTRSPAHFEQTMRLSLLTGTEDRACDLLAAAPQLSVSYDTRILCAARAGRWDDAALTFGSAQALGLIDKDKQALFARFLDPELAETAPTVPRASRLDPLSFRLLETIGEPQPTSNLPRAYAVADLRDVTGWKARIEAAERLTRAGALPENQLLGLYGERRAAASGGVWDRVTAFQRFETALETGSRDAIAKTLPVVWRQMKAAGLGVSFANLFADQIEPLALSGAAAKAARDILLVSPRYEAAGRRADQSDLAARIAQGDTPAARPAAALPGAVFDAFAGADPPANILKLAQDDRLGEAILMTLTLLHSGAEGAPKALTDALTALRALGLEQTARQAALQVLILARG